jgi:hypothetical protein
VESGRKRLLEKHAQQAASDGPLPVSPTADPTQEQIDAFYAAWVDDLLQQVIDQLRDQYHAEGKGNYFRVLYGRLCEEMSVPEISQALGLKPTDVENYYKASKKQLAAVLKNCVRSQTTRYCDEAGLAEDFQTEWNQLGEFINQHGGLEEAVRRSYLERPASDHRVGRSSVFNDTLIRYRKHLSAKAADVQNESNEGMI